MEEVANYEKLQCVPVACRCDFEITDKLKIVNGEVVHGSVLRMGVFRILAFRSSNFRRISNHPSRSRSAGGLLAVHLKNRSLYEPSKAQ